MKNGDGSGLKFAATQLRMKVLTARRKPCPDADRGGRLLQHRWSASAFEY